MAWGVAQSSYDYGFLKDSSSLGGNFKYGRPYDNTNPDTNSANFQLAFNEASGNMISEEASPVTLTLAGTPTYSQTGTGGYINFTGIKYNANLDDFQNGAAVGHLNLSTTDFTFEWVAKFGVTAQDSTVNYAYTAGNHGFIQMMQGINKTYFYFEATDATALAVQLTMSNVFDNTIHKHRLWTTGRGSAGSLLNYAIDGVSQGNNTFDIFNGKSIPGGQALFGWNQTVAYKCDATFYEYRLCPVSNANSGGINGG